MVEPDFRLSLSSEETVNYSRPSIDVLFETAADAYRSKVAGMILTGANSDGARGLEAVCEVGGTAIVQRPDSALVAAMPSAALERCPSAHPMTLGEIAKYLLQVGCTV
jgi:two-component system chemotaxis response regulator CheB